MADKWELIGKIRSSDWRFRILQKLNKSIKIPSELSSEVGISYSHVSDVLLDLMKLKLVVCKTPNLRKGKIYSITKLGKEILMEL